MIRKVNELPTVSVVCVTYNHANYIAEAIEGFLIQETSFPIEVIIHDDASTDGTTEIIKKYETKYPELIKPIYQAENQWSKGKKITPIAMFFAKGKYIALCEGDDYWTDYNKLQKQVEFLEANPDFAICFHKARILEPDGNLVDDYVTKVPADVTNVEDCALRGNYMHTPTIIFRNIVKIFPDEYNKSSMGDYFIQMLLSQHGKIKFFDEPMAVYRHGVGIWSSLSHASNLTKSYHTLILLEKYFKRNDNKLIAGIFDKRASSLRVRILNMIFTEDCNSAKYLDELYGETPHLCNEFWYDLRKLSEKNAVRSLTVDTLYREVGAQVLLYAFLKKVIRKIRCLKFRS